jgi:peptidoglycan/xylan/chitin deacetylase (PgdA/CDA1 family)
MRNIRYIILFTDKNRKHKYDFVPDIIRVMKHKKTKPVARWPYIVALFTLLGLSMVLRAAEVVGPKPVAYRLSDDDSKVGIVAVQQSLVRHKHHTSEMPRPAIGSLEVPILMYHRTPANFEQQISHLVSRGYTGVTLSELRAALLQGMPLPAKPVIITLDDGYRNQLDEVTILRKYNMKATLYMINGGAGSNWCIGANTKNGAGCEPYLNWDQVRQLDRGGLITIGSHTINHPDLAALTPEQQRVEILGGKQELERELGHEVSDFAYPYGSFNGISIETVRSAGFKTAVTTQPGSAHDIGSLFTLTRLRDSLVLP